MELIFVALGLAIGLLAGLLGIGGGLLAVPATYVVLIWYGFDGNVMHLAIATSLAVTTVTSLASTLAHHQARHIQFTALGFLMPGLAIGSISGAHLAHLLSAHFLSLIFGNIAILLGFYFFFHRLPLPHFGHKPNLTLALFGLVIGHLSSLLGIGGGTFTFPVLLGYPFSATAIAATSSAATFFTALIGTIMFLIIPSPSHAETYGSIYLPAFLSMAIPSLLTAPIGVYLARKVHIDILKRIFACIVILIGASMIWLG
ncbi:MAG: sulfite exporter TauE/SafE family protein [Verrucomicrobiota bacterium]|nr:sulfite exporter TauE/SafE family protein [Verrucomicrobiota bacterium]